MKTINIEQIGFMRPTIVRYENQTILSVNLSIADMCTFWREEFEIYDDLVTLMFEKEKEFRPLGQRTLANIKTTRELFYEQGFVCELTHQHEDKGE